MISRHCSNPLLQRAHDYKCIHLRSQSPAFCQRDRARRLVLGPRAMDEPNSLGTSTQSSLQRLPRAWVSLVQGGQPAAVGPTDHSKLRVLQWNLLADGLAQWGDFIRAPREVLEWSYRKPLILAEVLQAQADILCFQELNYFEEIEAALTPEGYVGSFLPKRQSPATKYGAKSDGVAIFWRSARFTLEERQGFHFTDREGAPAPQGCMTVLLSDGQGRRVLVATTHLKAKEGAELDRVRLMQMQQVLSSISATLTRAGSPPPGEACAAPGTPTVGDAPTNGNGQSSNGTLHPGPCMPVIVAGDFNTTSSSSLCQLLASPPWNFKSIWDTPTDTSQLDRSDEDMFVSQGARTGEESSCSVPPEFSTWKFRTAGESKRIIDHMWFTGLLPHSRWRMLNEKEIGCDGLPCERYPSDHIALCCEFALPKVP